MSTAIVWFRRDLRLADNPALHEACARYRQVVPVFIQSPEEEAPWQTGAASRSWLHLALTALQASLTSLGTPLIVRRGESLIELCALIVETQAQAVFWNRLYEPALIARDRHIKHALREQGIAAESFNAALLFEPWTLKTKSGDPYRVFTPFWRNASAQLPATLPLPAPQALAPGKTALTNLPIDALELRPRITWDCGFYEHWQPGEIGAWNALREFCMERVAHYSQGRDIPADISTSQLSPHLHFGAISPLQIATRMRQLVAENSATGIVANSEHFLREIGWREFAHYLLFHFPHTPDEPLYKDKFGRFPWRQPEDYANDLRAWQRGATGVPIIDAGMRELWATGWMHNRVRMIVASFLTKNLLIPWQEGARWFWDTLVDASLANNTLGWQWSAGCGADAAPYFRIFNPVLQSEKFDADGVYLKRWIPQLSKLDHKEIHAPWQARRVPDDYPAPIVDLAQSRERALAAYAQIKLG